ncbi:MAG: hypothetical protein ABH865_03200 [Candidatus Omnitrophota bacterium]
MRVIGFFIVCILSIGSAFFCFAECSGGGCVESAADEWVFNETNAYCNVLPRPAASWFAKAGVSEASLRWDLSNFYDGNFFLLSKLRAGIASGEALTGTPQERAQWQQVIQQAQVLPFPWRTAGIARLSGGRARLVTDEDGFASIGQELILKNKYSVLLTFNYTAVQASSNDMLEVVAIFPPAVGETGVSEEVILSSHRLARLSELEEVSIPVFKNKSFERAFGSAGTRRVEIAVRIKGNAQKAATVDFGNFSIA